MFTWMAVHLLNEIASVSQSVLACLTRLKMAD
jgi:hypothetical protein